MDTYPVAALGYRAWWVHGDTLKPLYFGPFWRPGVNLAYCSKHPHVAPGENCHCGFNIYHSVEDAIDESYLAPPLMEEDLWPIVGAVAAKGEIRVHHHGFRAEQAQPLALLTYNSDRRSSAVSEKYGVPVFDDNAEFQEYVNSLPVKPIAAELMPDRPQTDREDKLEDAKIVLLWTTVLAACAAAFVLGFMFDSFSGF